jgi:hypothetical protein
MQITHYYLGIIPCQCPDYQPNACNSIIFDDDLIELWGLERMNQLRVEYLKHFSDTMVPVDEMESFLQHVEEVFYENNHYANHAGNVSN